MTEVADSTNNLREIFDRQVSLLHEKSKENELDSEDIRKLETLTRAWKTFNSTDIRKPGLEDTLSGLSSEELLALIKS